MKRSHDFHEKLRLNLTKKLRLPSTEQSVPERGSDGKERSALPASSTDPQIEQESAQPITESSPSNVTELFRTRLSTKLKTALNGLVSQLLSQGDTADVEILESKDRSHGNSDESAAEELVLQNFIQSAKSQISGLLHKQQKISTENNTSHKPFNVDPLQIQISLKLQDLLCNALDSQRCENAASNSNNLVNESELRNLSHVLQDFLRSAKKKLSFSLNPDSRKEGTSTPEHFQRSVDRLLLPDKQVVEQELNKRQLRQRKGTKPVDYSESLVRNKDLSTKKQNKQGSVKDGQFANSSSVLVNKNSTTRPLIPGESCQIKVSDSPQSKSANLPNGKIARKNQNNHSIEPNVLLIEKSQSCNQTKSCHREELSNSSAKSKTNRTNRNPKTVQEMEYSVRDNPNYMNGGILLLSECERTPDFLDLTLDVQDSDPDEPDPVYDSADFIRSGYLDSDSEGDVVVLGEKRPTYQEITLDEDDEGEVCEQVAEVQPQPRIIPKRLQELLYSCPSCDKKFRVESLLKFHVRMHSVVESTLGRAAQEQPEIVEVKDRGTAEKKRRTPSRTPPAGPRPQKKSTPRRSPK